MSVCGEIRSLPIVEGGLGDYEKLARFHYRDEKLAPFKRMYVLRADEYLARDIGTDVLGVIVYSMPVANMRIRTQLLSGAMEGLSRDERLAFVNRNVRLISRVIVEPRFRLLGLGVRLVRETLLRMDVPMVESLAVMGAVNPFFERAGMRTVPVPTPAHHVRMLEAFRYVGVTETMLVDTDETHEYIEILPVRKKRFIVGEIDRFLKSFGKRRDETDFKKRIAFALSRLGGQGVYAYWMHPERKLRM